MKLYKNIISGFIVSVSTNVGGMEITESEYSEIMQKIQNKPTDPEGFQYKLRADTLEWELVELPPVPEVEDEPTIEDKAEAYDILMGEEDTE